MLGKNCKTYYLTTGTRATWGSVGSSGRHEGEAPSNLVLIESCKDVTTPGERKVAQQSDRGAAWETGDTGAFTGNLVIKLNHRTSADAGRTALETAMLTNQPIALAMLDGASDVAGSKGLWADFKVAKFPRNEPEEGHVTYDYELVPYDSGVAPEFVEVTSGT